MIRLERIMKSITGESLLLMNESFSSVNAREGLIIAEGILTALGMIGTRVAYVTHIYDLAKKIDLINAETSPKSRLVSMTAGITERNRRTYRITPGPPSESSFAEDIAHQYGISFNQIFGGRSKPAVPEIKEHVDGDHDEVQDVQIDNPIEAVDELVEDAG